MSRRLAVLGVLFMCLAFIPGRVRAQRTDIVRGRVVGADGAPIVNANVNVIDTVAKLAKPARTDAKGAFSVTIDGGSGTYTIAVTALGHAPQRRVITRAADGMIPVLEFKLSPVATQLGAVQSVGERPRPYRSEIGAEGGVGGVTSYVSTNTGLTGDVTGDITAALQTLPGITVTPSVTGGIPSVSAFGVGSDQNALVLNGLGFGAQVPRDGFGLSVVSSTYDPGRGGFAGVQLLLRMQPGSNIVARSGHVTLDAPSLQWTSPVAERLGTRYGQQVFSGTVNGPLVFDKAFYATSFQLSRRASSLPSLSSADAASLLALRVSPDSVSRLLQLLGTQGIPERTSSVPNGRQNLEGRVAVRLDFTPNIPASQPGQLFVNSSTYDDYYIEAGGALRKNDGAMTGPTAIPSSGGELSHRDGWANFTAAKYLPKAVLNELTIGVDGAEDRATPYLELPTVRVLVASGLDDGVGVSSLAVGGSSSAKSNSRTWSAQLRDQLSWNTWTRKHSFAVTGEATIDGYSTRQDGGFGSFFFNSLAAFGDGTPASYSRTLSALETSGNGSNWALGAGGTYNPLPPGVVPPGTLAPSRPTVQYGLRLEGNEYGFRPAFNASVDSIFGVRTDHVPSGARLMPMLGFSWPMFSEFKLPTGGSLGRRGFLRGGVREYRGTLSTRAIDAYTRQTGLPSAIQQLYCVGGASPLPDWRAYEQGASFVPTQCAGGTASTPLAQTTPPVQLFSPDYRMYDSWRPTLNLSYTINMMFRASLNATYAANRGVPGISDLNFNPATRFTLPSEAGRPVFVSPASIVPSTGVVAWTESRQSSRFAHVTESGSDLRSSVASFGGTLSYSPLVFFGPGSAYTFATLGYTFNDAREQFRGFGGTTAADPRAVDWSPGSIARHVVTFNITRTSQRWGSMSLQARAQSGTPFSPIIVGDVNGDGYSNDRAFVFDPAHTSDTAVANAMGSLLRSAPASARDCLRRQIGSIAKRNSCEGPWSIPLLNLSIQPDPYRFGFKNRGSVQLLVLNVLGGVDQLLHGSSKLRGWGQFAFPDPTLLTVRGFDAPMNRFVYTVNPQFGASTQYRNIFRAPFMLTLDARIEIGPDRESQYLGSLLRPRASEPGELNELQIKARISHGFNPIDQFLALRDSLKLSPTQVDTITAIGKRNLATRDSIASSISRFLVGRRGAYDRDEVRAAWHEAGIASYRSFLLSAKYALAALTSEQTEKAKRLGPLITFFTINQITEKDLAFMFRGPMSALP